jgi:hypothetical protein
LEDSDGDGDGDQAWTYGPVTIYIDANGNNSLDVGEKSTTTDANGNWTISGVTLGEIGQAIREVTPTGSVQTGQEEQTVDSPVGGTDSGNNFSNFRDFKITGQKLEDTDGDGDGDQAWTHGPVTIFIDANNNGTLDQGETSTTTDSSGNWTISGLSLDDVGDIIREVVPTGSVQTGTVTQTIENPGSGGTDSGNNFSNFRKFDISGTKYLDDEADGSIAGDNPVTGTTFTINLYDWFDADGEGDFDPGELVFKQTTETSAANGTYSFTGLVPLAVGHKYVVMEEGESGWVQSYGNDGYIITPTSGTNSTGNDFANYQTGSVSGTKYHDLNADGDKDGGENGLAGWTITAYVDTNGNGVLDAGETTVADSDVTDGSGNYSLTLDPGNYIIVETSQANWYESPDDDATLVNDGVLAGKEEHGYSVTVSSGSESEDKDFANFQKGSITGEKYYDQSYGNDIALAGWKIQLWKDVDGNGQLDEAIDTLVGTDTTDSNGAYSFDDLLPGQYIVKEADASGWQAVGGVKTHLVMLESGETYGDETGEYTDFYNTSKVLISGTKYNDLDADGVKDAGEPGLANWQIRIWFDDDKDGKFDGNETLIETAVTGAGGNWSAELNQIGTYFIEEVNQVGWTQSGPTPSYYTVEVSYDSDKDNNAGTFDPGLVADAGNDDTDDLDFLNYENAKLSGYKYEDDNGDGDRDAGEDGLAGWVITLYGDTDGDGQYDDVLKTATTNASGYYEFTDLKPGDYKTEETLKDGWVQTDSSDPETLTSGENDSNGNDFGNFKLFSISGTKYNDVEGDDNNTAIDADDLPMTGTAFTINLYDWLDDGDDVVETGELTLLATTETSLVDGSYSFGDLGPLDPGHAYYVKEEGETGWTQTYGTDGYIVEATSGNDADADFANHISDPGSAMTPGFWKNHPAIFAQETGKTLGEKYESVFDVEVVGTKKVSSDPTLGQALAAQGGGEAALLRASTAAWANATSDDLNYCYTDHDTILYGFLGSTGTDPLDLNLEAKLAAVIDQLEIIDLDDDGCLSAVEVIKVVQDVYNDDDATTNFWSTTTKLSDAGKVASLLDIMNNMPHIGANDFT